MTGIAPLVSQSDPTLQLTGAVARVNPTSIDTRLTLTEATASLTGLQARLSRHNYVSNSTVTARGGAYALIGAVAGLATSHSSPVALTPATGSVALHWEPATALRGVGSGVLSASGALPTQTLRLPSPPAARISVVGGAAVLG